MAPEDERSRTYQAHAPAKNGRHALVLRRVRAATDATLRARQFDSPQERADETDRHQKPDGRILLGTEVRQRLQIPQLHGGRSHGTTELERPP